MNPWEESENLVVTSLKQTERSIKIVDIPDTILPILGLSEEGANAESSKLFVESRSWSFDTIDYGGRFKILNGLITFTKAPLNKEPFFRLWGVFEGTLELYGNYKVQYVSNGSILIPTLELILFPTNVGGGGIDEAWSRRLGYKCSPGQSRIVWTSPNYSTDFYDAIHSSRLSFSASKWLKC